MRVLKIIFGSFFALLAVFFIGGFLLPNEWSVTRSIAIHASPERIYAYVGDFKEWEKWSPWGSAKDSTLKYAYSGPENGIGAKQSWDSEKMGKGWMQLISANPQTGIVYELFLNMDGSESLIHGQIEFAAKGEETRVTWKDEGSAGTSLAKRWLGVLIKVMLGREMDAGLADLKKVAENG